MKAMKSEKVPQGCEFNVVRRTLPVGLPDLSQESFGGYQIYFLCGMKLFFLLL